MGFYLKSKISQNKEILRLFYKDLEASKISSLMALASSVCVGYFKGAWQVSLEAIILVQ